MILDIDKINLLIKYFNAYATLISYTEVTQEVAMPQKKTDITGIDIENRRGEINKRVCTQSEASDNSHHIVCYWNESRRIKPLKDHRH